MGFKNTFLTFLLLLIYSTASLAQNATDYDKLIEGSAEFGKLAADVFEGVAFDQQTVGESTKEKFKSFLKDQAISNLRVEFSDLKYLLKWMKL
ncbi:MAG: hypothetical protein U5K72_15535 [Balneolaceae bacterium]|nr:hypothetical protein [Balneolaceae bacterium]